MITGKKFDIDGSIREVVKEDDTFVYFEGNIAIKKYLLGTKYEEYLDPSTFFNSGSKAMMDIADKIKKHDGPVNESAGGTQVNMQNVYQKQDVEDKIVPPVTKFDPNHNQKSYETQQYEFHNQNNNQNPNTHSNTNQNNVNNQNHNTITTTHYPPVQENPEEALFKKLKRNTKATFEIKIDEMVPTADFIRMMNDNFETSIIDFLSKQAVDKLLRDPDKLRKQIKAQLETTVYGAPVEEEVEEEKPTVSVIQEPIEEEIERPTVSIVEEATEEIVQEETPTVSVVTEIVEEIVETPVVAVITESTEEVVENITTPIVETNEKDLSAKD